MNRNILIIVILIIVIGGGVLTWQFWPEKEIISEEKEIYLDDELSLDEEIIIEKEKIDFNDFIEQLRNLLNNYCLTEDGEITEEKHESKYSGFAWLDENNEPQLIRGYDFITPITFTYDEDPGSFGYNFISQAHASSNSKLEAYERCITNIIEYMDDNLYRNDKNTRIDKEKGFDALDQLWGFEKNKVVCLVYNSDYWSQLVVRCGNKDNSKTPKEYSGIYNVINPDNNPWIWFNLSDIVGNFAIGGYRHTGVILERIDGEWQELTRFQDWPLPCEIVLERDVPPSLVDYECMSYGTGIGDWKYNKETEEWERIYRYNDGEIPG